MAEDNYYVLLHDENLDLNEFDENDNDNANDELRLVIADKDKEEVADVNQTNPVEPTLLFKKTFFLSSGILMGLVSQFFCSSFIGDIAQLLDAAAPIWSNYVYYHAMIWSIVTTVIIFIGMCLLLHDTQHNFTEFTKKSRGEADGGVWSAYSSSTTRTMLGQKVSFIAGATISICFFNLLFRPTAMITKDAVIVEADVHSEDDEALLLSEQQQPSHKYYYYYEYDSASMITQAILVCVGLFVYHSFYCQLMNDNDNRSNRKKTSCKAIKTTTMKNQIVDDQTTNTNMYNDDDNDNNDECNIRDLTLYAEL